MTHHSALRFPLPRLHNDLIFRVINGLPIPRVPVWMMRQAGRSDPAYRELREKDGRPLEVLFQDVEKSVAISLLPRRLGVDAIIMFQDILTPLAPMGLPFRFAPGPQLERPCRTLGQVQQLKPIDPAKDLKFVGEILQGLQEELQGDLPILGFAGSPMTLAFFLIAGGSPNYQCATVLKFMQEQPQFMESLLDRLTQMTIDYLNYQIEAGAHAVQLFESFGDVIPAQLYERYVQPTQQKIFAALHRSAPAILFVKEAAYLDWFLASGATVLSVGTCVNLQEALRNTPDTVIFQGNVSNAVLQDGDEEQITAAVQTCFRQSGKRRHILNLNHGLLSDTPFEHVQHFVQVAKTLGVVEADSTKVGKGS